MFKSGNSLALRLPKALGLKEGAEMVLREEQGKFILEPSNAPRRKIDVSKFAGEVPWLEPRTHEEGEFDESPRDWYLLGRSEGG